MSRTIKNGSVAYVHITVTDATGADISGYDWEVSVVPDTAAGATPVGEWTSPHATSGPGSTPNTYVLVLRVTATLTGTDRVKYRVFARPVTGDESEIFDCGGYTITP